MSGLKDYSIEELIGLLEQLQSENESLLQTVHSQADKIEMLSNSDVEMKKVAEEKAAMRVREEQLMEAIGIREKNLDRDLRWLKKEKEELEEEKKKIQQEKRKIDQKARAVDMRERLIDKTVDDKVKEKEEELERDNAAKLRRATEKAWLINSFLLPVLGTYSAYLTVLWCIDKKGVIRSGAGWIADAWARMSAWCHSCCGTIYAWFPANYPPAARILVIVIAAGLCGYVIYYLCKNGLEAFLRWHRDGWDKYTSAEQKRLKNAFTVLFCVESFMLAVLIEEKTGEPWIPYFLFLSAATTALHHEIGRCIKIY